MSFLGALASLEEPFVSRSLTPRLPHLHMSLDIKHIKGCWNLCVTCVHALDLVHLPKILCIATYLATRGKLNSTQFHNKMVRSILVRTVRAGPGGPEDKWVGKSLPRRGKLCVWFPWNHALKTEFATKQRKSSHLQGEYIKISPLERDWSRSEGRNSDLRRRRRRRVKLGFCASLLMRLGVCLDISGYFPCSSHHPREFLKFILVLRGRTHSQLP